MKSAFQVKTDTVLQERLPEVSSMIERCDKVGTEIVTDINGHWAAWEARVKTGISPTMDLNLFLSGVFMNYAAGCVLESSAVRKAGFERADFLRLCAEQYDIVMQNLASYKRGLS